MVGRKNRKKGRERGGEGGWLVSFPGPTHLSVTFSTEKRGEPGIFSHVR